MDNVNGRTLVLDANLVTAAIIAAEVKYLSLPEAGPYEAALGQKDTPRFSAQILWQNLGGVIPGVSDRDTQLYKLPDPAQIYVRVRSERNRVVRLLLDNGDNEAVRVRAEACNRIMEILQARKRAAAN
jgi:hypothetical protein